MHYFLLLFLPLLLLSKPFKVATYNVENLFDATSNGTEYKEYSSKHGWTKAMVQSKLAHTADVICDINADIIGLQEIENKHILHQLQHYLKRVGCEYRYSAITSKQHSAIQTALLSRFEIISTKQIVVNAHRRPILEVLVDVKSSTLRVFVNHWKSKAYRGLESKRIASAKALQMRVKRLKKSEPYILLGDFNTDYDAHLKLEKKIDDTGGKIGLHHLLNLIENGRLRQLPSKKEVSQNAHFSLWSTLPLEQRWNVNYYGKRGTPDHIILSASLFDKKGIEYVSGSFRVFKREYLFTKKGYINRWQYRKQKHQGKGYSDHLPLYALFDTKPYRANRSIDTRPRGQTVENIEYFYTHKHLKDEVILKDVVVLFKRGNHAIIKQTPQGRAIFIYGVASQLKEGRRYDVMVRGMKSYHGLKELTSVYLLKEKVK